MNEKYLTRDDLKLALGKIMGAMDRGEKPEKIKRYLRGVLKRADISWEQKPAHTTSRGKVCEEEIHEYLEEGENDGDTFREIARGLNDKYSVNFIRSVVGDSDRFTLIRREDKTKYYGYYPWGVCLKEDEE